MTNKELRESLNKIDIAAFDNNTTYYDLRNLYEAVQMTAQERADLARKVQNAKSDEDYAEIHGFLAGKLDKDVTNEAFGEYELDEPNDIDYDDEDKWIHTYEAVFFNNDGQVDINKTTEFNSEEEAIEYAKENGAKLVTDWFYDKEDPEIPNYSEVVWEQEKFEEAMHKVKVSQLDNNGNVTNVNYQNMSDEEIDNARRYRDEFEKNARIEIVDENLNEGNDTMSDDEILDEIAGTLEIEDINTFKNDVKSGNGQKYAAEVEDKCCDTCKARFKQMLNTNENLNEGIETVAAHELAKAAGKKLFMQPWKALELIGRRPRIIKDFIKSGLSAEDYFDKQIDYFGIKQYSDWFANGMKERFPGDYEEPKRTFAFEAYSPENDKEADSAVEFIMNRIERATEYDQLADIYDLIIMDEDNLSENTYKALLDAVEEKINSLE